MTKLEELQNKLKSLEEQLRRLEGEGAEEITKRRVLADMGDDYRENEGAKLVMEQHDIWYIRKVEIKREIGRLRREIIRMKSSK